MSRWFQALEALSHPAVAKGNDAKHAQLYRHMKEVAEANGFDSLSQAIAEACAARKSAAPAAPKASEPGVEEPTEAMIRAALPWTFPGDVRSNGEPGFGVSLIRYEEMRDRVRHLLRAALRATPPAGEA